MDPDSATFSATDSASGPHEHRPQQQQQPSSSGRSGANVSKQCKDDDAAAALLAPVESPDEPYIPTLELA